MVYSLVTMNNKLLLLLLLLSPYALAEEIVLECKAYDQKINDDYYKYEEWQGHYLYLIFDTEKMLWFGAIEYEAVHPDYTWNKNEDVYYDMFGWKKEYDNTYYISDNKDEIKFSRTHPSFKVNYTLNRITGKLSSDEVYSMDEDITYEAINYMCTKFGPLL